MIKKRRGLFKSGLVLLALGSGLLFSLPAHASFNANNLMDDGIFDNTNTMNAAQIDAFLNTFPSSCISTNRGFTAPEPIGYSPAGPSATLGFTYGSDVSAGTVIYNAAKAYGLNPQVILTTLEKEEGLVTGSGTTSNPGCSNLRYSAAMGYLCTDTVTAHDYSGFELYSLNGTPVKSVTGTCVQKVYFVGFSRQVIWATWTLKKGEQGSEGNVGWNAQLRDFPHTGNVWDNSDDPPSCYRFLMTQGYRARADSTNTNPCPTSTSPPANSVNYYDGLTTIDGVSVHLDTGPTASLYNYTPHFAGNQSFDSIFLQWFGGIYAAPYATGYAGQSGYPQLNPGQQASVYIKYQNLGNSTWYDDTSIGTAPAGTYPVHLATSHAINRSSAFYSTGWLNTARPAINFSAVYLSDGTTLTTNQHVATPGQIVKFSFNVTAPGGIMAATYPEYFQPIAEGSSTGLFNDLGTCINITINPVPSLNWVSQSGYPAVAPSLKSPSFLSLQNNGSVALYDDTSLSTAPAGTYPVHLATANPLNRVSAFSADWPSSNRVVYSFSAVYESDGVTLAVNQHVAQPGQIVRFSFNFTVPAGYTSGSYREFFQPILEGTPNGVFTYQGISYTVTVPSTPTVTYTQVVSSPTLASNQPANLTYTISNTGNATLLGTSQIYTADGSYSKSPSWTSSNIIGTLGADLAPGQSTSITVPIIAPLVQTTTQKQITLSLVNSGTTTQIPGSEMINTVAINPSTYQANYVAQSPYPTITYNQLVPAYFTYKNTGNQPWYDDTSIDTASWPNAYPVHLATSHSLNRLSGFATYSWLNVARPTRNFSAVYESDGVTLAVNQHVAQPGQIVRFGFDLSPASWVSSNTFNEYFQLVAEGTLNGAFNDLGTYLKISVVPNTYRNVFYSQSAYPSIISNHKAAVYLMLTNIGNSPWYDDTSIGSAPIGTYPVHLATANPLNRVSAFSADWPSSNRAAYNFSAVYESDGITLAANQHVAQTGQIVKFTFNFTVPAGYTSGSYTEYFQPILEGTPNGVFNNQGVNQIITVQ